MAITIVNRNRGSIGQGVSILLRFRLFWDLTIRIVMLSLGRSENERLAGVANSRGGANHQNKSGAEAPLTIFDN
jgi:hypothetical protein